MLEITTTIFTRLHFLSAAPLAASTAVPHALSDPDTDTLHKLAQPPADDAAALVAPAEAPPPRLDAGVAGVASMTSPDAGDFAPADAPAPVVHGIVSVAPLDAAANGAEEHAPASVAMGYGLPAISTIFEYIINLIGEAKAEDVVFGLSLCLAALQAGGDGAFLLLVNT